MSFAVTVLLVDDHAIVRQGCRLLLQQAGFEIVGEASSGEEAYASYLKHPPRVVIVDLVRLAISEGVATCSDLGSR